VGSRLGTHIYWTLASSAAIILLALSPLVLPGAQRAEHLPPPLVGVEKIGEVIASALAPQREKPAPAERRPAGGSAVAPAPVSPESGSVVGVLAGRAGDTASGPAVEEPGSRGNDPTPRRPRSNAGPERPKPGRSAKAERKQARAQAKAERKQARAQARAEQKRERKDAKATKGRSADEHPGGKAKAKPKAKAKDEGGSGHGKPKGSSGGDGAKPPTSQSKAGKKHS
jgi:hypothetical protein